MSSEENMSTPVSELDFSSAARLRPDTIPRGSATKIGVRGLTFYYAAKQALFDVSIDIQEGNVTAYIGPSGCGKSTFLRTLNRLKDVIPGTRVQGQELIDDHDIYAPGTD